MNITHIRNLALALTLAVLTAGCQTLQTSNANPEGALFYQYVQGQTGVFYTVSGVTFYELNGERPGKFHTVGGTTYYNFGQGKSGHFQSLDGTSFYNFDEGTSGTFFTHSNGTTEYGFGGPAIKATSTGTRPTPQPHAAEASEPSGEAQLGFPGMAGDGEDPPEIAESTFYEER